MDAATGAFSKFRPIVGLFSILGIVVLVWALSNAILYDDTQTMMMGAMGIALAVVTFLILKDWRSGFFLFIFWLLFEDLARKYLGNNMVLYFGKDALAGITYLSLYLAKRRGQAESFRPPFLLPLALFLGLAVLQVFNLNSPTMLYGVLGLKLYFYYVPLMFVGYALVRSDKDLNRFLVWNVAIGVAIAVLGVIQSIVGLTFLNPTVLAPDLQELGEMTRESPLTHRIVPVPTSVFVSGGRFSSYMIFLIILAMGAQCYSLASRRRRSLFGFLGIGMALAGAMQSGSRGSIIYSIASVLIISVGLFWGGPARQGRRSGSSKAVVRALVAGALGLFLMVQLFPDSIGAVWAFYTETLSPNSSGYEFSYRAWDYPLQNLEKAFDEGQHWMVGGGTGTASLGGQYITKLVGAQSSAGVENGYGNLVVEMGVLGLVLWMAWTFSCLYYGWKIVQQLRGTVYFPVGLSIVWFSFLLLVPFTFGSMTTYQNFILNAYFWILTGVLFRLPHLARQAQKLPEPARVAKPIAVPALVPGR